MTTKTWDYRKTSEGAWEVGFYDSDKEWHEHSTHGSEQSANARKKILNDMKFLDLPPLSGGASLKPLVRFFLSPNKDGKFYGMKIILPEEIAKKLGVSAGCRVNFSYSDNNYLLWFIKKAADGQKGYSISKASKSKVVNFSVRASFIKNIEQMKKGTTCVKHDFYNDGLIIYADQEIKV